MHVLYIQGINTGVQLKVYIYNLHIIKKMNLLKFKILNCITVDANGVHIPGNWGVCNDFCPTEKKGSNSVYFRF